MDLEERQEIAAIVAIAVFALGIPVVVLAGCAFVMGWLSMLGAHGVHETVWGWISTRQQDAKGHTIWGVSDLPWKYYLGVASGYLIYQVAELGCGAFRLFKGALS